MLILNLFIGLENAKIDGKLSLLPLASHLFHCADVWTSLVINIILGLPDNICVMWLIEAGPGNKALSMLSLNQAICELAICMANVMSIIAINSTRSSVIISFFLFYAISLRFMFSGCQTFMSLSVLRTIWQLYVM